MILTLRGLFRKAPVRLRLYKTEEMKDEKTCSQSGSIHAQWVLRCRRGHRGHFLSLLNGAYEGKGLAACTYNQPSE